MAQTVTIVLGDDDIIDYKISREHWEPVEFLRTRGFTAGATTASNTPVFSKWPGSAPGFGNEDTSEDKLITDGVQDNYNRNGRRGARKNRVYVDSNSVWRKAPELTLTLFGAYDVIDPANAEWIQFDVGAVANLRGTAVSDFRWIARSVSVSYEGGTARTTLRLDAETHGEPGVDDTPPPDTTTGFDPGSWTPPDWNFPPDTGILTPTPTPFNGLVPGLKRLALIGSNGHIYRTTNFERSSVLGGPSYDDVDLSATIGTTVIQWCYDPRSNTTSTNGWVVTPTAVYHIRDIWGTPTATSVLTFSTSSLYRNLDFNYTLPGYIGKFGMVSSRYSPGGTKVAYTLDGSVTWSSEVTVDTGVSVGAYVPALQISARTPGKAWTFAYPGSGTLEPMRVTTNFGANWSALANIYDDDGFGGMLIVPFPDTSETIAYFGYVNVGGTTPNPTYANTNNVFRGAIDTGMTDITPIVGGVRFGPDQTRSRFTLSGSPESAELLLVCGVNAAGTSRGVFVITNAASAPNAAGTSFTTVVVPGGSVPYTRGAMVNNSELYLFGLNLSIAYSGDQGVTYDSRIGNLSGSAEVVGVTG